MSLVGRWSGVLSKEVDGSVLSREVEWCPVGRWRNSVLSREGVEWFPWLGGVEIVSLVGRYRGLVLWWVSRYTVSDYETQYMKFDLFRLHRNYNLVAYSTHTIEIGLANLI